MFSGKLFVDFCPPQNGLGFYLLFASLVSLTQAQSSNDGCITCYLDDLFKGGFEYGLEDIIPPAAARFFTPDLPSNPGATDPAQGFVEAAKIFHFIVEVDIG